MSIRLPAALAHLANASHGRYELSGRVTFTHRGTEWASRVETDKAVAYRIHYDPFRGRLFYDLSGQAEHRDAQLRHALTRLPHWTRRSGHTAPSSAV